MRKPLPLLPRSAACTALATTVAALPAAATGFDLPDQDAFAIARGMAFVATADNPSAIYYNPAGITQLPGHTVRAGIYGLYLKSSYDSPLGGSYENDRDLHAIPQLFYTYTPEKLPLSFGLGLYTPFGLSSSWPEDTGFRTIATEGRLNYYTINPVVAWKIFPTLSVSAGVTANYSEVDIARGMVWPTQAYDEFRFEGDGWAAGYNIGIRWQPCDHIAFGATYRSQTDVGLGGNTSFRNDVAIPQLMYPAFPEQNVGASADFPFPWKMIVGVSYRPTPKWNIEFNADLTGWERMNTVTVRQDQPFPPLLPQDVPLILNWESSWYYELGATHYFAGGWSVSAGYIFNENSVPDANYTPLVADLDRHFGSVGVGYERGAWRFDLAYQFGYGPERTVTGSAPSATGQTADGRYEFISQAVALSAQIRF